MTSLEMYTRLTEIGRLGIGNEENGRKADGIVHLYTIGNNLMLSYGM